VEIKQDMRASDISLVQQCNTSKAKNVMNSWVAFNLVVEVGMLGV
jgi:hypothetical protein